jgi:poly(3-hydroxybutyrate) depolymerase
MTRGHTLLTASIGLALFCGACSSSNGGASGSGGAPGLGGAQAGGSGQNGGTVGNGGSVSNGGAPGTGGRVQGSGGGSPASGGQVGSGGEPGSGGRIAVDGGRLPTTDGGRIPVIDGGRPNNGGAPGTGGSVGPVVDGGGTTPSGGAGGQSAGCGSTNTTSPCGVKGTTCSLDVSGTARTYYVQLPSNYNPSKQYPLIFQFHPWGGSADQALTMYGLNKSSGIPDAIYVTPQGLQAGSNGAGWANTNGQDIAFTKAMVADVQGKYCVDNARIFSVGFSYGGMMSFAVACEMSTVFRAIAPMSGSLYSDMNCKGTGAHIAMWGSHGTSDTVVPIADGRAARDKVLQQNHCGTTTTPVDPSPCVKYQGCDPGYDVTWCEWDGGHGIPSFGSAAIISFFKQF